MHGGARSGAGRKKGAANKRTRAVVDQFAADGIMPIEVILNAMRHYHAAGEMDKATDAAIAAAPYCHPRLSAVQHGGKTEVGVRLEITEEIVDGRPPKDSPPAPSAS